MGDCPEFINDRGHKIACVLGDDHAGLWHSAFERWTNDAETRYVYVSIQWGEWQDAPPEKGQ